MKKIITIVLMILFLLGINVKNHMSIYELIEFNYKLFLISNAGLVYLNKNGSKMLEYLTNDPNLVKMNRRLQKKYGNYVSTYIISKAKNYYVLDAGLAKKILKDSPQLFRAGDMKDDFFKSIMPENVGISRCHNGCPWKKRRKFNEDVLGTKHMTPFFNCVPRIVEKSITKPPLNIKDFKKMAFIVSSKIVYGRDNSKMLEEFNNLVGKRLLKTIFYKEYLEDLHESYRTAPFCSLLYYANMYKNDDIKIIDDQIPHWFAPLIFMNSFLIPNLLCCILNFNDIKGRILKEINGEDFNLFSKRTYLHYCTIEHMRLFNTVNINIQRTAEKDMNYCEMNLNEGDQIFILFSNILRDGKEFKEPDRFLPLRWKNKSIEDQNIVFSVGNQQCPSKNISPLYYKAIIYHLLKNFNYEIEEPKLTSNKLYFINPYEIKFSTR